jgi:hypothetical protein
MRRHIVGVIALALFAAGAVFRVWPHPELEPFCWRLGAITAAFWLAYPDLLRLPAWLLAALPVLAIVLARWPKCLLLVIPVFVVLAILKPRWGPRPPKRPGPANQ